MRNSLQKDDIMYVDVILPLALNKVYTYSVPIEFRDALKRGIRVEVPLKNKFYSGIVFKIHKEKPIYATKHIISLIDEWAVVTPIQLKFWQWLSDYYCSTLGEVMKVALPSGLKMSSETSFLKNPFIDEEIEIHLNAKERILLDVLDVREELTLAQMQEVLQQKSVYKLIKEMLQKRVIYIKETLKNSYKPKLKDYVYLEELYEGENFTLALDMAKRSERQTRALIAYYELGKQQKVVPKNSIYKRADVNSADIKALVKKGVFRIESKEVSRLSVLQSDETKAFELNKNQEDSLSKIKEEFESKDVVLFQGVTGSGKTQVYIELIREEIKKGSQVLYLVPEIALTTQLVGRLAAEFGNAVGFYHSKMSSHERVELWSETKMGKPIVIGARSSLFLPFENLSLIIVDEEHDGSYKQQNPNPRYNARDGAIVLASLFGAKVVLGSATPSLESIANAVTGKYGKVMLSERYGDAQLPEIIIVDMSKALKQNRIKEGFSDTLINAIAARLERKEQVLIFQNRRGYSPHLRCNTCGWLSMCKNCDVAMTVHKYFQQLRCHYCGSKSNIPVSCPACGSTDLVEAGIGTEKIEDYLNELFPDASIDRMDYDTVRTKSGHEKIIERMEDGDIDIMVGTQMITKGLDFENITLVGVLNADQLLYYPDFRAGERAFQLLTQVSGRAGRKTKKGEVIIQTYQAENTIINKVVQNDFEGFLTTEIEERENFIYPPYYRLIAITLKHKKPDIVQNAAIYFSQKLKAKFGKRVIGPSQPPVARVQNQYIQQILLKFEKNTDTLSRAKKIILNMRNDLQRQEGFRSVRVNIDVDPY